MDQADILKGLNQGQQEAVLGFIDLLFNDTQNEIILSGAGGVGKTYTMGVIIDKVMPYYYYLCNSKGIIPKYDSVSMTATTNKAAEVLGEATKKPTQTIHSFLNLKVKDDFKSGKSILTKNKNWRVHERLILFIDESSMIDFNLYKMIQEGTKGCKIVYVGDHSQLAPVMEKLSCVYKRNFPFFNLIEPVRSNNKAIMDLCNQFRETVETGIFKDIKVVPGSIDWLTGPEMEKEIIAHFKEQTKDSKIIAYTNKQVIAYNEYIRGLRNLPNSFSIGENLISNSAIKIGDTFLHVEQEISIYRQEEEITQFEIIKDTFLDTKLSTIQTLYGDFADVYIPIDMEHYYNLIKYFAKLKNWERYFFLKNNFPDFRQADACTAYKAQGSTYNTVFIDLANISTCNMSDQVARMLYVAFSRPRHRIILYGQLNQRYGQVVL